MGFPENLKAMRTKERYTQAQLSRAIGVRPNTIWRWESGNAVPDAATVAKIAKFLNTSIAYLMGETDNPLPTAAPRIRMPQFNNPAVKPATTLKVPLISGVVSACCDPGNAYASDVEWEVESLLDIPASDLVEYAWQVGDRGFRAMHIQGDSMEPKIHDGDIVLFGDLPISNGNFALVCYDERLIVRGVWDEHNGHYRLRALNPLYEDIDVDLEDTSKDFIILGKVLRTITSKNIAAGMM